MFDLLPTVLSEIQRRSHTGGANPREIDRHIYQALLGDGTARAAPTRRAARRAMRLALMGGVALGWLIYSLL